MTPEKGSHGVLELVACAAQLCEIYATHVAVREVSPSFLAVASCLQDFVLRYDARIHLWYHPPGLGVLLSLEQHRARRHGAMVFLCSSTFTKPRNAQGIISKFHLNMRNIRDQIWCISLAHPLYGGTLQDI
jgi:hypothetical protein